MKISDNTGNSMKSDKRISVGSTDESNAAKQVQPMDDSPVYMNTPGLKPRGFRADQLVEMAGMDSYTLSNEAPRMDKMKG